MEKSEKMAEVTENRNKRGKQGDGEKSLLTETDLLSGSDRKRYIIQNQSGSLGTANAGAGIWINGAEPKKTNKNKHMQWVDNGSVKRPNE